MSNPVSFTPSSRTRLQTLNLSNDILVYKYDSNGSLLVPLHTGTADDALAQYLKVKDLKNNPEPSTTFIGDILDPSVGAHAQLSQLLKLTHSA
jgi:hypothetical protein